MGGGRQWGEEEDDDEDYINSSEASPALRNRTRKRYAPDRPEPDNTGKAHANIVVYDLHGLQSNGLWGGVDVSPRGARPDQGGRGAPQGQGGHEDG